MRSPPVIDDRLASPNRCPAVPQVGRLEAGNLGRVLDSLGFGDWREHAPDVILGSKGHRQGSTCGSEADDCGLAHLAKRELDRPGDR